MEAAPLSLAKSVVDGLLVAKSAIADEVALQLGVQRELAFIKEEFEMMQAFLMAADEEQSNNRVVKTWVKQVRDLAYDVEDCIQLFTVHLEKPSKWQLPCTVHARHQVANEIKKLKARVEDVSQRNLRYRLIKQNDSAGSKPATASLATLGIDEAPQDEAQAVDLVKLISSSDVKDLRVVSVWGASDHERMSAVREAYDDPLIRQNFKCRAWVKLTQPFDPNEFLKSLVRQFHANSRQELGKSTEEEIVGIEIMKKEMTADVQLITEEFKTHVNYNDKRYFIVLEGLSDIEEWDRMKTYLPDKKNGSRIMVSTQHAEMARSCVMEQPNQVTVSRFNKLPYNLQPLYLFFNKDCLANVSEQGGSVPKALEFNSKQLARSGTLVHCLVGRDKEKALLISQQLQQLRVISIWGMGGIGKTTFFSKVYTSPDLSSQLFERRAWVTVLRPFSLEVLLRTLLKQLYSNSHEGKEKTDMEEKRLQSMGFNDLSKACEEHLNDRSFLIVLDDLSTIEEWNLIWNDLRFHNKKNGRIIVTTRGKDVATHCAAGRGHTHELKPLEVDAALDLFYKKVFSENKDVKITSDMTEQAKLILKRCGGLPLAITTVGGFLADKHKTTMEWKKLYDHISVELENNPNLEMIKTVLSSSFAGLPYHLKSCFLYLGIFPEDHNIRRKRLVRRWIAEGYMRKRMANEEIGEDYFFDLISKSMIQASKEKPITSGRAKSCRLHDLMREVSISSATEENLIALLNGHDTLNSQAKIRHLVINNKWSRDRKLFKGLNLLHTRSLTVFGEWKSFFVSHGMKMLRVLDLEDSLGLVDEDLKQICELRCLRYLGLRGTRVCCLPKSLGRLQDLETLDVRKTFVTKLPNTIVRLGKLQYLRTSGKTILETTFGSTLGALVSFTKGCLLSIGASKLPCFEEVPGEMIHREFLWAKRFLWAKHSFGRFDLQGVKVSKGIGKLKRLHTLGVVNISRGKAVLKNLRKLTQLRKLGVTGITPENSRELCSTIADLTNLQSLFMRSCDERGLFGYLDDMSVDPPKHLQSLELLGNKLRKLPSWVQKLNNLVKMYLRRTELEPEAIQVLKQLQSLTILYLRNDSFVGDALWFDGDGFPKLELLRLQRIGVKLVKFEEKALPKLELLQIRGCRRLTDDGCSGLQFLQSLKEVLLQGKAYTERLIKNLQDQVNENTNHPNLKRMKLKLPEN